MNWKDATERYQLEAEEVLQERNLPTDYSEITALNPKVEDHLLSEAIAIITGIYYLHKEVAKGNTDKALDRFFSICDAYEKFFIYRFVPDNPNNKRVYRKARNKILTDSPELLRGALLTDGYIASLRAGVKSTAGSRKATEERQKNSPDEEDVKTILDQLHKENPKWLQGTLQEKAGGKLKITARAIRNITSYNPRK